MKIKVNNKTIKALNPRKDRFKNYLKHYSELSMDILEFLALDKITAKDKLWVAVRLMPRKLVEAFAVDCSIKANISTGDAADAAYSAATNAYYAATAAADAAFDTNAVATTYANTAFIVFGAVCGVAAAAGTFTNTAAIAGVAIFAAFTVAAVYIFDADNAAKASKTAYAAYNSSLEDSVEALAYLIKGNK